MFNIKKWGLAIGLLSLMLAFSGCTSNTKTSTQTKESASDTKKESASDTKKETESEKKEEEVKDVEYERGILTDTTYESSFIGIRYNLPENSILSTQEEADELLQFGADLMYDKNNTKQAVIDYAMAQVVGEMIVTSADQLSNLVISVEKLPMKNISEAQYLDASTAQILKADMQYERIGENQTMTIAGQDYLMMTMQTSFTGVTITQQYAVRKIDDRMIVFVITDGGAAEGDIENLMSGFSKY